MRNERQRLSLFFCRPLERPASRPAGVLASSGRGSCLRWGGDESLLLSVVVCHIPDFLLHTKETELFISVDPFLWMGESAGMFRCLSSSLEFWREISHWSSLYYTHFKLDSPLPLSFPGWTKCYVSIGWTLMWSLACCQVSSLVVVGGLTSSRCFQGTLPPCPWVLWGSEDSTLCRVWHGAAVPGNAQLSRDFPRGHSNDNLIESYNERGIMFNT